MKPLPSPGAVRLPEPAPRLSVVIPCRNEGPTIGACLASVLENGYPEEALEVLVVDGGSADDTARQVREFAGRHANVRLLDNPRRTTPAALNLGLARAGGEAILRLDGHAALPRGYLSTAVAYLFGTEAAQVGGVVRHRPRGPGIWPAAMAAVLGHPFGVGNSRFRTGCAAPAWADTAFGACWRREALARAGDFNERLERGQDFELNQRLRAGGGRILLVPELVVDYWVPASLAAFARQAFRNGRWAILPFLYARGMPVAWRHLAPLAALAVAATLATAAGRWPAAGWILLGLAGLYGLLAVAAAAHGARRTAAEFWALPVTFAVLHACYAAGAAAGCGELIWRARRERNNKMPWTTSTEHPAGGARGAPADYAAVTERPDLPATRDQLRILAARYAWAAGQTAGGLTLEAACGAGLGLGVLAEASALVTGLDLDPANTAIARATYAGDARIAVETGDALALPFPAGSFDTVILFEAIYYLPDLRRFLEEAGRVLRPGGRILLSSVNPEWSGFAPSPLATRYWKSREIAALAAGLGLQAEMWTGFPEERRGVRARAVAALRRAAARLRLFPGSLRAKARLKQWFYGPLTPLPARLEAPAEPARLTAADSATDWTAVRMYYVRLTRRTLEDRR